MVVLFGNSHVCGAQIGMQATVRVFFLSYSVSARVFPLVAARISRKEVSRKMFFHMKYSELNVVVVISVLVIEMETFATSHDSIFNERILAARYLQPKE